MNILLLLISDGHEAYLDHAVDQLDPDLKPVPPQPNCPESMQVYEDHRLVSTTNYSNKISNTEYPICIDGYILMKLPLLPFLCWVLFSALYIFQIFTRII